jgi:hypothetical protein
MASGITTAIAARAALLWFNYILYWVIKNI